MERLSVEGRIAPEVIEGFVDQYPAQVAVIEHALREAKAIPLVMASQPVWSVFCGHT